MAVKKVGILYHPMKQATYVFSEKLCKFLSSRSVSVWLCSAWEVEKAGIQVKNSDLILTVGGDGTILRAAQAVVTSPTPIVGINLGRLGFMTELSTDEATEKLSALLAGEGWVDERAMLEAELMVPGKPPRTFFALNDVVVARGSVARIISIDASIDDQPLTTFHADGLIIATATGSTGYSLAAGGPILPPQSMESVLVPILPHLSLSYSLVLPATATVKLGVSTFHEATLSIDGHINIDLTDSFIVTVKQSNKTTRFLRIHPEKYFYSSLEQKLKGKQP